MHVRFRVPPDKTEGLLDEIYRLAKLHGTFDIVNLIDEAREDLYLEVTDTKESHHGRT